MHDATRSTSLPQAVDSSDWLKTAALICAVVGHFGQFFAEDDLWWSVFGLLAAPAFFFLMGYAKTRAVPVRWIWIGAILTVLDSSNNDWTWMPPNILLSLALVRIARPYVEAFVQRYGWAAYALVTSALLAALPITAQLVDYGAEGWLWALFGLYQRRYVDGRSAPDAGVGAQDSPSPAHAMKENAGLMRLLACSVAAAVYVWQEQKEYSFPQAHFGVVILCVGMMSVSLCLFRRGPSRIQPPQIMAGALRFIGRHTLEIYAIQLAGSELIVKFVGDLGP